MSNDSGWGSPSPDQPQQPGTSAGSTDPGGYGWGSMPGWTPPPAEVKPGVIPLRPLSVLEILDGGITTIRSYPRATLGLAAVVVTISQVFQFALLAFVLGRLTSSLDALPDQPTAGDVVDALSGTFVVTLVGSVVAALGQIVLTGLVTVVVSRGVLGKDCSISRAWQAARPQILPLLGVTVLSGLIVGAVVVLGAVPGIVLLAADTGAVGGVVLFFGLLAGVVGAVYLYVSLALASPAVVLEKQGVIAALRRSHRLVRGTWWRITGILLLTSIIVAVVAGILSLPLSLLSGGTAMLGGATNTSLISLALSSVATIVSGTLTWPFASAVSALLYIDVRMRREGLDLELARAAGVPPLP